MSLNAGDAGCTTGLSGRIYSLWTADASCGFVSPLPAPAQAVVKAQCFAIARAVVAELQANAVVTGITTGGGTTISGTVA